MNDAPGPHAPCPAHRTLLEVLRDNHVVRGSSCEIGVCGSCECGYLSGEVIHRDAVLGLKARGARLMPRVSRAQRCLDTQSPIRWSVPWADRSRGWRVIVRTCCRASAARGRPEVADAAAAALPITMRRAHEVGGRGDASGIQCCRPSVNFLSVWQSPRDE